MEEYSVEIIRDGNLAENSAVYFKTEDEVLEYAKTVLLEDNEELYVTVLDVAWEYEKSLTDKANSLVQRFED